MGQKTNPIALRIGKTQNWKSKYFEKKTIETAKRSYKDLEIQYYIQQFLKNYGLMLHICKLNYNDSSLNIFISYYLTSKLLPFKPENKNEFYFKIYENSKKVLSLDYQFLNYKKTLKTFISNKKLLLKIVKFKTKSNEKLLKLKNNLLSKTKCLTQSTKFINQLTEGLSLFNLKKLDICLTLQQLNRNIAWNKTNIKFDKAQILNLRRFYKKEFFNDAINLLTICNTQKDSSRLLAEYIAINLKKQKKRHNLFLRFLKNLLTVFGSRKLSILKGIQIKIKGRFNGIPRAKHLSLKIGEVPIISMNSRISYYEATSYAQNGTFGVKVWLIEK